MDDVREEALKSGLNDYFACPPFGAQKGFEGPGQVGQGELVGYEGLKPDCTPFDQVQSYLEIPTISATSADLDFLLGKKVDRKMNPVGLFE